MGTLTALYIKPPQRPGSLWVAPLVSSNDAHNKERPHQAAIQMERQRALMCYFEGLVVTGDHVYSSAFCPFKGEFGQTRLKLLVFELTATVSSICAFGFFLHPYLNNSNKTVPAGARGILNCGGGTFVLKNVRPARHCWGLWSCCENSPAGSGGRGGLSSNDNSDEPFSKCLNERGRCIWCSAAQSNFDGMLLLSQHRRLLTAEYLLGTERVTGGWLRQRADEGTW